MAVAETCRSVQNRPPRRRGAWGCAFSQPRIAPCRPRRKAELTDALDRLFATRYPLFAASQETYQYDPAGNLSQFTDRKNQVTTFTYDSLNRRIGASYADGSSTSFVYDSVGHLTKATDSIVGAIEFLYDNLDRLIKEVSAQGVVEYTYDALGRRSTMKANGATPVSYSYDAASRLTQVAQAGLVVGLGYDNANRRTSLTYPNGTNTAYSYDNASRLTAITHNGPAGVIEGLAYVYDAAGNRISLTRTNGTATNLPAAVQAAYDAANEQVTFNSLPATFDANGNQTTSTDASGTTTYTWDARNRLVAQAGPGVSATFQYDALGRRISKTINGTTTQYLYDGQDIAQEIGGSAVGASYVRTRGIDEAIARQSTNGNEFYHADANGNVLFLTNGTGVTIVNYSYEAFGKTTIIGTSSNSLHYTGRENDGSGLYYYRARYYATVSSRFLSEDPLGGKNPNGELNFYLYTNNSPLNFTDPSGLYFIKPPSTPSDPRIPALPPSYGSPLDRFLLCLDLCYGAQTIVTSTFEPLPFQRFKDERGNPVHGPGTPHGSGQAVDVQIPSDPGKIKCCAAKCGARWGHDQGGSNPHLHFQLTPVGSGQSGSLPKPGQCGCN